MSDTDFLYVASLEKRLEQVEKENAKLKDLLKQAVEDIRKMQPYYDGCDKCKAYFESIKYGTILPCKDKECREVGKWKHHDEALKLIGGAENG